MSAWKNFITGNKLFFKHWASYIAVIFCTTLIVYLLGASTFNWFTSWVLKVSDIPYVSYNNLGEIITGHLFVALLLLLELLVILIVIYWQFAFILLSIQNIRRNRPASLAEILRRTVSSLRIASPLTFLFFLGYFIVILPFSTVFLSTPLLNKVKIPGFIMTFLLQNPWYTAGIAVLYVVIAYVGVRLFLILPLMILQHKTAREAFHLSLQKTRGRLWFYVGNLFLIVFFSSLVTIIIYGSVYGLQTYLDSTNVAFAGAMVNLFIVEIVAQFTGCYVTALVAGLMISGSDDFVDPAGISMLQFGAQRKRRALFRWLTGAGLVATAALVVLYNVLLLNGLAISKPMAISHRGVDNGNGVQNTIPALKLTSKEKPNYVEMDIHETKDHKFVVMHDENLEDLAGINKAPYQLTLKQLTKITVRENGHHAKIASFDNYLKTANKLHQKLLVEIKVTPHDSKNMTKLFVDRYEKTLLAHHDRIHTLSYPVVTQLKQLAPKLFVSFILPYNLTFPETKANAYTMEATTLDSSFIANAEKHKQQVYAWTVDDTDQMDQMMFMGVNAIITDQLGELKSEIKQNTDHPSYANLILAQISDLDSSEDSNAV
ncbi:glycerophosphodiester phosphodiesterase [Lentilactobacillus sp. SPB1-3]|uniref:Glycerophosphodiester phosphodiesterase n=1 Tax=Lentilactobacillus terminaliae TaxID=3003483 RepID=A0ACD5DF79_9LACO|nr:glycerophosphodiester phosphodiesterase [Lentilactobacillus sp. SPB1-3]MCZ0976323.1 glycerophosphodiester phosphodiesterase [Lentilactobacillus sp. SPB1-3]